MAGCSGAATYSSSAPAYVSPAPAQPTGLNVSWGTPTSASSVAGTLSWSPVSGATSYQVSDDGQNWTNVGNTTSWSFTATPGQSYQFYVKACN